MADKERKAPGKMRLFLLRRDAYEDCFGQGAEVDHIAAMSDPGDISDKTARALVDAQGPGEYMIITGRARVAKLSRREITEFSLK